MDEGLGHVTMSDTPVADVNSQVPAAERQGDEIKTYDFDNVGVKDLKSFLDAGNAGKRLKLYMIWHHFMDADGSGFSQPQMSEELGAMGFAQDLMGVALRLKAYGDSDRDPGGFVRSILSRCELSGGQLNYYYLIQTEYLLRYLKLGLAVRCGQEITDIQTRFSDVDKVECDFHDGIGTIHPNGNAEPTAYGFLAMKDEIEDRCWYAPGQEDMVRSLNPLSRYLVLCFREKHYDMNRDWDPRMSAMSLMDSIIAGNIGRAAIDVVDGRVLIRVRDIYTKLWLVLSDSLNNHHVEFCETCGRPFLVKRSGHGKTAAIYCSASCKRTMYRVERFQELMDEPGMDEKKAARAVGIKPETAMKVMATRAMIQTSNSVSADLLVGLDTPKQNERERRMDEG